MEAEREENNLSSFKIGDIFGFIDLSGNLKYLDHVDYQVTISDKNFINYSNLPNTFVIQNMDGEYVSSFWTNGYPMYISNRLFMVKNDTTGISEINEQGEMLWSSEFTSLLTSISITEEYVLAGLLDGRLILLDSLGKTVFEVLPGGSRIQVIYACSINSDATLIAGISGINPQRFFYIKGPVFENSAVNFIDLEDEFRREIFISFGDSEKYIFFEGIACLNVFDIQQNKLKQIPVAGSIKSVEEFEMRGIVSVLSESGTWTELKIIRLDNNLIYREIIPRNNVFMDNIYDSLLIGYSAEENGIHNTHLLRYDLMDM
jgi:hypothetical protein